MKYSHLFLGFIVATIAVTASAQSGYTVTTHPSPPTANAPFTVSVTGYFDPAISANPNGPTVSVSGNQITTSLNFDCGFATGCPPGSTRTYSFNVPPLQPGTYSLNVYQGDASSPPPRVTSTIVVANASSARAAGGVRQVPTLSQWSLLLLAALLASMGMSKVMPPRE